MKVSVIIPVRDRARVLRAAVESALNQTYAPHEIIVVDDGSSDDPEAALRGLSGPLKVLHQPAKGPAAARNLAAGEASGDWLAFLDSDDLWLPEKLAEQARAAREHPGSVFIHSDGWVVKGEEIPSDLPERETHFSRLSPAKGRGPDALATYLSNPVLTPSVLLRKEAFLEAGGFDESFEINEDADLFVRVFARGGEAVFVPKPLVIIRILPDSIPRDWMTRIRASLRVQEKALRAFPEQGPLFKEALWRGTRIAAQHALFRGRTREAAGWWLKSFRYRAPGFKELAVLGLLFAGPLFGRALLMKRWSEAMKRFEEEAERS